MRALIKSERGRTVSLKVSGKGGVSVYGLGRFPVTLYKEQWTKLLAMTDEIRAFLGYPCNRSCPAEQRRGRAAEGTATLGGCQRPDRGC